MSPSRHLPARPRPAARRLSWAAAAAAGVLVLSACAGESPETPGQDADSAGDASGEPAADGETTTLRLGHIYDPNHPNETCGVPAMNEALAGSGLEIESYPSATLGSEEEMLEQVADGSLELSIAGPAFLGVWDERAAVFDAAYLFSDVDHFDETINGEIGQEIWDGLQEESGLTVLRSWYYGTRHVTANKPIRSPEDMAGVKIRVPNAPLYLDNTEAMGGTATPMALSEVYLALQQGAIDAQENPIPTIDSMKFQEVQDTINLTGHVIQGVMIMASEDALADMPEDQRAALEEATVAAGDAVRTCIEDAESEMLEQWRSEGVIEVVDDIDVEAFRAAAVELLPERHPEWADLYREIQSQG